MVWSKGQPWVSGSIPEIIGLPGNFVRKGLNELNKKRNPWISIVACLVVQLCVGILYLWSAFKGNIVAAYSVGTVSYTHLTLPTSCSACRSRWSPYH